jgi:hypothetical protein
MSDDLHIGRALPGLLPGELKVADRFLRVAAAAVMIRYSAFSKKRRSLLRVWSRKKKEKKGESQDGKRQAAGLRGC